MNYVILIRITRHKKGIGKQWRLIQLLDEKSPRYFDKYLNFSIFFLDEPCWETPLKSGIGWCVPDRDGCSDVRSLPVCMRNSSWSSASSARWWPAKHDGRSSSVVVHILPALSALCLQGTTQQPYSVRSRLWLHGGQELCLASCCLPLVCGSVGEAAW